MDEGQFNLEALMATDECFLSNTTMEVMPATQLNGRPIGSGRPGPLTGDFVKFCHRASKIPRIAIMLLPPILLFFFVIFALNPAWDLHFS